MKKKKLLYITELFPYPPTSGGKIKSLNTIQTLSKNFNITLISFSKHQPTNQQTQFLKKYTQNIQSFILPNIDSNPKEHLTSLLINYLSLKPYLIQQFSSLKAYNFVKKYLEDNPDSIIHCDHLSTTQYLPKIKSQIWIHEEHNIESQLAKTNFIHFKKWKKTKLFLLIEWLLIFQYEMRTYSKFDHIFSISDVDTAILKSKFKVKKVTTQPLVYISDKSINRKNSNTLAFVGDMTWGPNKAGISWFISEVLPIMLKHDPNIILSIIGKVEQEFVDSFTNHNAVKFTGFVKSLQNNLKCTNVFILPFHSGGGVRIKALTAMSHQIPISSTTLGIQGLNVIDKYHCLIADDAKSFALNTLLLLKNMNIAKMMANNAFKYLQLNHSKKENTLFLNRYKRISL